MLPWLWIRPRMRRDVLGLPRDWLRSPAAVLHGGGVVTGGAFSPATRRRIIDRDDSCCVACGKYVVIAYGDYSIQHRKARGMGGTRRKATAADGLLVHGTGTTECHGFIEANPEWAVTMGYRVPQWEDVREVPVYVAGLGWRLLDDGGNAHPLAGAA